MYLILSVCVMVTLVVAVALALLKWCIVIVPEYTALAVLGLDTGQMEVLRKPDGCTSGFFLKSPLKQVKLENFVSLVRITVPIDETYVADDGSVVEIDGFIQYQSQKTDVGILKYLQAEDSQIVQNVTGQVKTHLTKDISTEDYRSVRSKILKTGSRLAKLTNTAQGQPRQLKDIEESFGIDIQKVALSTVKYDKATQEAISSRFEMQVLEGVADPSDAKLIMLDKRIEKKVYGLDLGAIDPEVAKALGKSAEEIAKSASGPVLAAGIAAAAATSGNKGQQQKKGGK